VDPPREGLKPDRDAIYLLFTEPTAVPAPYLQEPEFLGQSGPTATPVGVTVSHQDGSREIRPLEVRVLRPVTFAVFGAELPEAANHRLVDVVSAAINRPLRVHRRASRPIPRVCPILLKPDDPGDLHGVHNSLTPAREADYEVANVRGPADLRLATGKGKQAAERMGREP
jgi:hypothetical protein